MSEPQLLNHHESEAWKYLAGLLFRLPSVLESQLLQDEDLTLADYMVLQMLTGHEGNCARMTDIADMVKIAQPRMTRIVTKLEKRGYVQRANSAEDRRVVRATLTEQGLEKLEQASPNHIAEIRKNIFDRLTPEQIESLISVGKTLLDGSGTELSMSGSCQGSSESHA